MQIELVYEKTCPNVEAARSQLLRAFAETGIQPRSQEWEVSSPEAPPHVHGYGSPTILIDSRDVAGDVAMYVGLGLLVSASLWNAWPKAQRAGAPCPACVTLDQEPMRQS